MDYQYAKDAFEELKNFEGKADFKDSDTVIDYFVLLPKAALTISPLMPFLIRIRQQIVLK